MNFFEVVFALEQGQSVRMSKWERSTRMYLLGNALVCQRGEQTPYEYQLSWKEMKAKKWSVIV